MLVVFVVVICSCSDVDDEMVADWEMGVELIELAQYEEEKENLVGGLGQIQLEMRIFVIKTNITN